MFISFKFHQNHLLFLLYIIIEFLKRLVKNYITNSALLENNIRNLEMFISHILILIVYYFENKGYKTFKKKEKNIEITLLNTHIKLINSNSKKKKKNITNIIILILLTSIFSLIAYFPMKEITGDLKMNANNSTGFFILILLMTERKIIKNELLNHHIFSCIVLLICSIFSLFKVVKEKKFTFLKITQNLIIYCLYHYIPISLIYNIYYYIHENYYISLNLISGIQGIFSLIGTLILEILIYIPQKKNVILLISNINFLGFLYSFLIFIFMAFQNLICIIILYYFKPSLIGILNSTFPTLDMLINIIKRKNKKNKFDIFYQILLILSALIYCEVLILNFWGLEIGVRENIINRGNKEKKRDEETNFTYENYFLDSDF